MCEFWFLFITEVQDSVFEHFVEKNLREREREEPQKTESRFNLEKPTQFR